MSYPESDYLVHNVHFNDNVRCSNLCLTLFTELVTSIKPTENKMQPTMASVNYSSTGKYKLFLLSSGFS